MKVKITNTEIREYLNINSPDFDKYVSPIINLANQFAQGTRPRVVGQLSELIQEFNGHSLDEWKQWYLRQYPNAIEEAKKKIMRKLKELKKSLNNIDENIVEQWVKDLVIVKTFLGLRFQEAILKKGADLRNSTYRLAQPDDEAGGIDGYIGETAVSIKPETYRGMPQLQESISAKIIYYRKIKGGIEVDFGEIIDY